jgi:transcriptional regulator with XRE-family HTH domain
MTRRLVRSPVAQIRVVAGFNSAKLAAQKLGCSLVYLQEIESGRAVPSEDLFGRMAKVYGVGVKRLEQAVSQARTGLLRRELDALEDSA